MVHSAEDGFIPVADMSALIARLEAAEAGSRELDVAIRDALIPDGAANDFNFLTGFADRPETHGVMRVRIVEEYTTSLGAALALAERVLPGYEVSISQRKPRHLETCAEWWHASLFKITTGVVFDAGPGTISIKSATPALALCIAILKAKAQGEGDG